MTPAECSELIKAGTLLGESAGFWVQTVVFGLTAIAAIVALFYNAKQLKLLKKQNRDNENHAKLRATIDKVSQELVNVEYRKHRDRFIALKKKGTLTPYAAYDPQENEGTLAILEILNNYEFFAIGTFQNAFDENIYRDMKKTVLINDWKATKPFIEELRNEKKHPNLFIQYQRLAEKWDSEK